MSRRIGWLVVRAEVGLDLDDAAGNVGRTVVFPTALILDPMDKNLAQQPRSHQLRRSLKESAA